MHKISVINTSYNPEGRTMFLTNAFMKGFKSKYPAAETKVFHLAQWNFNACQGCLDCWFKHPGQCVNDDDFSRYIKHINESYMVIFACPVWVGNANHLFRNFTERFFCCFEPYFIKRGNMYGKHPLDDVKIKEAVMITTCALPGMHNFEPVVSHFKSLNYLSGIKTQNCLMKPQSLEMKYLPYNEVNKQLNALCHAAGSCFATTGTISEDILYSISKPYMPEKEYIDTVNKDFRSKFHD
ncbi:MAG: flavodoxin family protein [Bacteroidota bacterium]